MRKREEKQISSKGFLKVLGGARYEIVKPLGEGATAQTFLCRDLKRGGEHVAFKLFHEEWCEKRPDLIDREFRTLSGLSHPSIARVLDFGKKGSRYYLVSEWVEGATILEALQGEDFNRVVLIFFQLFEALSYLYFRNVVHLDLKPQNVLVETAGGEHGLRVKLIDFGLAFPLTLSSSHGSALGSPPFTAPEFALRRPLSTRSDLYSVGVLFYAALSNRRPFEGEEPAEILNHQLQAEPIPLKKISKKIPNSLSDYVDRLMARDPKGRFENPQSALKALQEVMGELFPRAPLNPIPLFEDPDLIFRESPFQNLLERILSGGGRFAIEGEAGSGKTFLARWLERNLLLAQKTVLFLSGDRTVLWEEEPHPSESPSAFLIIDRADEGPLKSYLKTNPSSNAILLGRDLGWLPSEEGWQRIVLNPLSSLEVRSLLEKLFGPLEEEVFKRWEQETEGRPQNFVRYGRSLLRRGVIEKKGLGWFLNEEKFQQSHASKKEDIASEAADRKVLELLKFSQIALDLETLAAWMNRSVSETAEILESLVQEGRLERRIESGREFYRSTFPQEAGEAPLPERAPLWIESLFEQGRYREGVDLFERVFSSKTPDDPVLILLKAKLLSGAGEHSEVFGLLPRSFLAGLPSSQQALGRETLGKSLLFTGRPKEAEEAFEKAVAFYESDRDFDGLARGILHLGILAQRAGEFEAAKEFYRKALEEARKAKASSLLEGVIELNMANILFESGDFDNAEKSYRKSLDHLLKSPHGAVTGQAYLNYANFNFHLGKILAAEHFCREALRFALDHRYPLTQGRALLLLAMIHERHGSGKKQEERLNEALEILKKASYPFETVQALIQRAHFLEGRGDPPSAEADAREALEAAKKIGASDLEAQARFILGKILGSDPRHFEEALQELERARTYFEGGKISPMVWASEFERGELERKRGDFKSAERFYRQALRSLQSLSERWPEALQKSFQRDRKQERIEQALQSVLEKKS